MAIVPAADDVDDCEFPADGAICSWVIAGIEDDAPSIFMPGSFCDFGLSMPDLDSSAGIAGILLWFMLAMASFFLMAGETTSLAKGRLIVAVFAGRFLLAGR